MIRTIQSTIVLGFTLFHLTIQAEVMTLDEQRQRYLDADLAIKRQDKVTYDFLVKDIKNYALYPYLDYKKTLNELDENSIQKMTAFEKKYQSLPFIQSVRSRYLDQLANKKLWRDFLTYQPNLPRSEKHQCNYYYAHSQNGDLKTALKGAKKLFRSGNSIHSACDPLFEILKTNGGFTDVLILDRMLLAFENRNLHLLKYLQKQLSSKAKRQGDFILDLYLKPNTVAEFSKKRKITSFNKKLTIIAFKKLLRTSRKDAIQAFDQTVKGQHLSKKEIQQLADNLSSRLMSSSNEEFVKWRDNWLKTTEDVSLLERRFRLTLTGNDWSQKAFWLNRLTKEDGQNIKWQYWQARVLAHQGNQKKADKIYASLLGQRHFYSVAAAMHLDEPIQIPFQKTPLDHTKIRIFDPALLRVKEFVALNQIADAKREWQHLLYQANQEQKAMLAAYASKKDWYHLAVQATIAGKLWEHLEFRFPIAYRGLFEFFSKERELSLTTLLALSRQESAFYTHARSPVGASGLMQIMPATAKETSRKLGVRFLGTDTLKEPMVNIGLGSGYLKMLLEDYDANRILAFAAYNAGPHRVKTWLSRSQGNLDAIAFIEAIPFYETRGYVQNVLMYDIYYRKLLGMPLEFLQKSELTRAY